MENKIKVLKVLEISHRAKSKIQYWRLEILVNTEIINPDFKTDDKLFSKTLKDLLVQMSNEGLIIYKNESEYSITPKGLEYLEAHSEE